MKKLLVILVFIVGFCLITGFLGPKGDSVEDKKKTAQKMKSETLRELYKLHPQSKEKIKKSKGYAVFNNTGVNVLVLSTGNGWGVAHNMASGKEIYMNMASAGVGLGLGIKDFRGVFVFSTQKAFDSFVTQGWQASGQADAVAKAGEKGDAADVAIDVAPGVELYQITKNGLAVQATIQGTKYWKNDELN